MKGKNIEPLTVTQQHSLFSSLSFFAKILVHVPPFFFFKSFWLLEVAALVNQRVPGSIPPPKKSSIVPQSRGLFFWANNLK